MNKVKLDLDHVVCCVSSARYTEYYTSFSYPDKGHIFSNVQLPKQNVLRRRLQLTPKVLTSDNFNPS
jgi:hypothetical protein